MIDLSHSAPGPVRIEAQLSCPPTGSFEEAVYVCPLVESMDEFFANWPSLYAASPERALLSIHLAAPCWNNGLELEQREDYRIRVDL